MISLQFVVGVAFSIVPPIIPLVLPAMGVDAPATVRTWAGVLIGVTPLAAALASPHWGRLADRVDRRLIILLACMAAAVCTASMSLATTPWELLALRFTMGLFGGHLAAGLSIVSAAVPMARLGASLGWMATAQLTGTLVGPLIGGGLADFYSSLRAPFLIAGAAAFLISAAVAIVPKPPRRESPPADTFERGEAEPPRSRPVGRLIAILLLAQCSITMTQPVISLHVRELVGTPPDLATLAGLAFSVVGLGGLLAAPLLGRLSDRMGARRLLSFILLASALCLLPQAYAASYRLFVLERFLGGLFICSVIPIVNSLVGKAVVDHDRGRVYGLTSGAAYLGGFLGPLSGGLLGAHWGLNSVFLASGIILLMNTVGMQLKYRM